MKSNLMSVRNHSISVLKQKNPVSPSQKRVKKENKDNSIDNKQTSEDQKTLHKYPTTKVIEVNLKSSSAQKNKNNHHDSRDYNQGGVSSFSENIQLLKKYFEQKIKKKKDCPFLNKEVTNTDVGKVINTEKENNNIKVNFSTPSKKNIQNNNVQNKNLLSCDNENKTIRVNRNYSRTVRIKPNSSNVNINNVVSAETKNIEVTNDDEAKSENKKFIMSKLQAFMNAKYSYKKEKEKQKSLSKKKKKIITTIYQAKIHSKPQINRNKKIINTSNEETRDFKKYSSLTTFPKSSEFHGIKVLVYKRGKVTDNVELQFPKETGEINDKKMKEYNNELQKLLIPKNNQLMLQMVGMKQSISRTEIRKKVVQPQIKKVTFEIQREVAGLNVLSPEKKEINNKVVKKENKLVIEKKEINIVQNKLNQIKNEKITKDKNFIIEKNEFNIPNKRKENHNEIQNFNIELHQVRKNEKITSNPELLKFNIHMPKEIWKQPQKHEIQQTNILVINNEKKNSIFQVETPNKKEIDDSKNKTEITKKSIKDVQVFKGRKSQDKQKEEKEKKKEIKNKEKVQITHETKEDAKTSVKRVTAEIEKKIEEKKLKEQQKLIIGKNAQKGKKIEEKKEELKDIDKTNVKPKAQKTPENKQTNQELLQEKDNNSTINLKEENKENKNLIEQIGKKESNNNEIHPFEMKNQEEMTETIQEKTMNLKEDEIKNQELTLTNEKIELKSQAEKETKDEITEDKSNENKEKDIIDISLQTKLTLTPLESDMIISKKEFLIEETKEIKIENTNKELNIPLQPYISNDLLVISSNKDKENQTKYNANSYFVDKNKEENCPIIEIMEVDKPYPKKIIEKINELSSQDNTPEIKNEIEPSKAKQIKEEGEENEENKKRKKESITFPELARQLIELNKPVMKNKHKPVFRAFIESYTKSAEIEVKNQEKIKEALNKAKNLRSLLKKKKEKVNEEKKE